MLDGPFLAGGRVGVAGKAGRCETGKERIVSRVASDELALKMRGKFGDGEFVAGGDSLEFVAIGSAFGGALEIEKSSVPCGDLHGDVAKAGSPGADRIERVEGWSIAGELREEYSGSLDRFHWCAPSAASRS